MFNLKHFDIDNSDVTEKSAVTVQKFNADKIKYGREINLNRWQLREFLKGNRIVSDDEIVKLITNIDDIELREGIIEYLLSLNHSNSLSFPEHKGIDSIDILSPRALDGTKEEFYNEK